ncbi:MAG TPA: YybS family protein [Desulfuromonadaceae bacterium]|jgi:hypothetical protein
MNFKPQGVAARLTAAAIGTVSSFLLFAANMIIPPVGFFSSLLAPFPALYFWFRNGRGTAAIITLAVVAILTAVFGFQVGALYLIQCGVIALAMPEFLVRGLGASRSIAWTTAVNLAVFALIALFFSIVSGQSVHDLAVKEINSSITQAASIYEQAGFKGEDLAQLKQSMYMAAGFITKIYPALITLILISVAGCNLALLKRQSPRLGLDLKLGDFKDYKNSDLLVWLLIASGFAQLTGQPLIIIPALNLLVIIIALYFLQGLAVILTVIARQPFATTFRVMLYLMLLFQPYLAALIAAIGIFDLWGDFRTPRKKENL